MSDRLPPERAVRLLRAKVGEYESMVKFDDQTNQQDPRLTYLTADLALIADILASYIEDNSEAAAEIERLRQRLEEMSLAYIAAANPGIDMEEVKRTRGTTYETTPPSVHHALPYRRPRIDEGPWVTKSGRVLTDEDIQALADEAEAGYDVEHLKGQPNRPLTGLNKALADEAEATDAE